MAFALIAIEESRADVIQIGCLFALPSVSFSRTTVAVTETAGAAAARPMGDSGSAGAVDLMGPMV